MPRRLIRCETHLLKSLSTLLVGLVIDHSNQVDALLHNLDLQLRHALAVLDLETVPWKFGPLVGQVKLTPFTRPKVQQLTNMLA